ncbi:MAG TPA: hypothetical protein VH374_26115 [Polyangia bacterium]|nr:hypothetical protein [Polyangia bacterium]
MSLTIAHARTDVDPPAPVGRVGVVDSTVSPRPIPIEVVDVTFEPVVPTASAPQANTVNDDGRLEMIMTLESERRAALAGYNHRHTDGDCPICRRAVAAYR